MIIGFCNVGIIGDLEKDSFTSVVETKPGRNMFRSWLDEGN